MRLCIYYDAFLELQFDRTEQGRIPWTVKVKYAQHYKFDETQTENLIYFLRILDETYNKWSNRKQG